MANLTGTFGEIRPAREEDAAGCLEIYRPVVLETPISFETEPPSLAAFSRRMEDILLFAPWLVCVGEGKVRGYAYASRFRARPAYQWSVETTVYVARECQGRGVGEALYRALLAFARAQGFVHAYGVITLPNPGSVALHEKLGFRPLGVLERVGYKLGSWHDVGWWQLCIAEPPASPSPPLSVAEVLADGLWPPPGEES